MKDLCFYFYIVNYWDEISEQADEDCGFIQAESLHKATLKVSNYYGENCINKVEIRVVEEGDSSVLTFDMFKSTLKEAAYGKK